MNERLILEATRVLGTFKFDTYPKNYAGKVGCALLTADGNLYSGISLNLACNVGNCAEQAAILEMLKRRETQVVALASCYEGRGVIPPCGRCREMLAQIDSRNLEALISISETEARTLRELLPFHWALD